MNLWKSSTTETSGATSDLAVGLDVLGRRYRLERLLGIGSTGPVWLALDRELGTRRALKFLSDSLQMQADELEGLKQETLRCQELTHQNIVRIYDFVRDERHAAISMEHVDGPNLREALVKRQPPFFDPEEIEFWVEELCRALHYAHTFAGVIHRDLKPSNLLITRQGNLKVADFGIAKVLDRNRRPGEESAFEISGTLDYISPQQMDNKPASVADDVYSFGVTLFELLAGRPPFTGDDIYEQVLYQPPPSVSEVRLAIDAEKDPISSDWESVIEACLAKEPDDRPGNIRQISELLGLELRNVTLREPVLPSGFQEEVLETPPGSRVAGSTIDNLPARRVRTLRDVPIHRVRRERLPRWLGGAAALLLLGGVFTMTRCDADDPVAESISTKKEMPAPGTVTPTEPEEPIAAQVDSPAPEDLGEPWQAIVAHLAAEDFDAAESGLKPFLASHPQDARVRMLQAKLAQHRGDSNKALETLRALLKDHPRNVEAVRLKAHVHAGLAEWQAVTMAARWALALSEDVVDPELLALRGRAHRELGNIDEAIADFTKAIRADTQNAKLHYERALTYQVEGSLKQASKDLSEALLLEPAFTAARKARAYLAMEQQLGLGPQIEEDLSRVIDADETDVHAIFDRMRCRYVAKNWEGVLEDCEALTKLRPDWEEDLRQYRINANVQSGRIKAEDAGDVKAYLEQKPKDAKTWKAYADHLLQSDRYREAIAAYSNVINEEPNQYASYQNRAFAYYGLANELRKADKEGEARHEMRLKAIRDLNFLLKNAPRELITAETYLLKAELHFLRGGTEYADAQFAAREGMRLFSHAKKDFLALIDDIKAAERIKERQRRPPEREKRGFFDRLKGVFGRARGSR